MCVYMFMCVGAYVYTHTFFTVGIDKLWTLQTAPKYFIIYPVKISTPI